MESQKYTILETLSDEGKYSIYRAEDKSKNTVILKILNSQYPSDEELFLCQREYKILEKFQNVEGIAKVIGFEKYKNGFMIVFKDSKGESLESKVVNKMPLYTFYKVAKSTVKALNKIHEKKIIHRDIKPSNILYNPDTSNVEIIDFGSSTDMESGKVSSDISLQGNLLYISPEQTGRVNRQVDYRSDFYSLGATFYHLLTGKPPFAFNDPMDIIYSHIAKEPLAPHILEKSVPEELSKIVLKLLSKNPEDRYQSSFGILFDIDFLNSSNYKSENFVPGKKDFSLEFHISGKLYGREKEVESLVDTFSYMYKNGKPELSVILGNAGIGKTALVREIQKPIATATGYFISGEYEQYSRNLPFSGFIKSFSMLVQILLTESPEEIQNWRNRIITHLGNNAGIVTEVIPELELIIGEQPEVTSLDGQENSNRFYLIFQNFIRIFCNLNHPLVLFLDDMQWADPASIKMIQNLMLDSSLRYIYIILTYRTSEDTLYNPFLNMLDSLKKEKMYPRTLKLEELKLEDLVSLLSNTFYTDEDEVHDLAKIVYSKTAGNPFFINELLKELSAEKKIYSDFEKGKWVWDLEDIRNTKISDNIIKLLIIKIKRLSSDSQLVLKVASCIGTSFDIWTMSVILKKEWQEVIEILEYLAKQEFIYLRESSLRAFNLLTEQKISTENIKNIIYQFKHDRLRYAAYELLEEKERKTLQLSVGRIQFQGKYSDDNLFEIVNHLNAGYEEITDIKEIENLIELNIKAALKAKLSTAYLTSLEYLSHGLNLLNHFENPWKDLYSLTIRLYRELVESYFLNVQFEKLEDSIEIVIEKSNDIEEITHAFKVLISYYTNVSDYAKAIETGRKALNKLGIVLPEKKYEDFFEVEFKKIDKYLQNHSVKSILKSRKMEDNSIILAVGLLNTLLPSAYLFNSELWVFLTLKSVSLHLEFGNSDQVYGFSCLGIILCSIKKDYIRGHEFGKLAFNLSEKFENKAELTKAANVLANFTLPFREHLKNAKEINLRCLESGRESGEFQHVSYSLILNALNEFYLGTNLIVILNDVIPKHMVLCKQAKSSLGIDTINALRIILLGMTSSPEDKMELEVIQDYEKKFLIEWKENNNYFTVIIYEIIKIFNLYIQENYLEALEMILKAKELLIYAIGLFCVSALNFIESLVLCALYRLVDPETKKIYIEKIKENQKQMKEWSKYCPENFQHQYYLVEAELARINKKYWMASTLYDKAIENAHKNEFIQNEAIANELCGKFYLDLNKNNIMHIYLTEAYYLFNRWGAVEKTSQLEKKYPDLFSRTLRNKQRSDSQELIFNMGTDSKNKFNNAEGILDLNTVIKASQALAEEINLEKLLKKFMSILFESAGAEKGLFIKMEIDKYFVLASGNSANENVEIYDKDIYFDSNVLREIAPVSIVNYVARTKKYIVIVDAEKEELFINDQYIRKNKPKSILCYPVYRHENMVGIIYLENNYTTDAFTKERLEVLNILSTQIAISIENSELYATLEAKVEERTANLNNALQQVKVLKEKQDGDYFLTSLLIQPLGNNNIQNDFVRIDFLIEQKKKFMFKSKEVEIGGDLCTADRIILNQRSYIVVLNADAMGKSIQGAGGILVLGSVFKSIIQRTHSGTLDNNIYPEKWIKNSFLEMQRIFESFDGYMLISLVLGLLDEENGALFFINVEHPRVILYRNKKASFIEKEDRTFRKMGVQGINTPIHISLFQMNLGDVLIIGSDGRDDIILGLDENGLDDLNFNEELILDSIEKGDGDLKRIYNSILSKGKLTDDLSLLRLSFMEIDKRSSVEIDEDNEKFERIVIEIKKEIEKEWKKKNYGLVISKFEQLISLRPLDTESIVKLSLTLFKLRNYKRFIEFGELVKLRDPENSKIFLRLIIAHIRLKSYQRSSNLISEILGVNPLNRKVKVLERILSDLMIRLF